AGRQSRLGRGSAPAARLRRRHDPGRDHRAVEAPVAVAARVRDPPSADARPESARRGRDLVRAVDHVATVIETERLALRLPTAADVEDPPSFLSDPRVMDFLGGVGDDPSWVVRSWLEGWEKYPAGKLIVETAAGERIGRVGLNFYDPVHWTRSNSPNAQPEL